MKKLTLLGLTIAAMLNTCAFAEEAAAPANSAKNEATAKTVVVTATKTKKNIIEVPANVTVITAEDIKKNNYQNMMQVLQNVPGMIFLDTKGEAGFIGMRVPSQFGGATQVKVLIDGTEVNISSISLDLKQIEKIEVVKGPNSALYGSNTAGGVVNIFLKKGSNKERVAIGAQSGGFNDQIFNMALQDSNEKYDYSISANVAYTTGPNSKGSAVQSNKYTGKINYYIDDSSGMYLNFTRHAFPFKQAPGYLTRAQYEANYLQSPFPWINFSSDGIRFGTGYQKQLSDTQNVSFDVGYTSSTFTTLTTLATTGFAGFRATGTDSILDTKLKYGQKNFLVQNSEIVTGIDYGSTQSDSYSNPAPNGVVNTAVKSADALTTTKPLSIYLQDEFAPADKWKITLGGRYDSITYGLNDRLANIQKNKSDGALTPKATISYSISDNSNIYVGYGQSFTPPTQGQLFKGTAVATANPNLVPELAANYEIGYKLGFDKLNFNATIFNTDVTNSIVIFKDPVSLVNQYRNAGSSRYTGLELTTDYKVNQNWLINLGYTLEDAKFVTYQTYTNAGVAVNYSGKNIQNVPTHNGIVTIQYNNDGFTASLVNRMTGGYFPGADNVTYYNGHILTDLTFSWNKPDYEIYLSGRNIFNNRYIGYESASGVNETILPGNPVSVLVGATYKF